MNNDVVTIRLVDKYLKLTDAAREKATRTVEEGTTEARSLSDMLSMCDNYRIDAKHFLEKGDLVRAFGAINYAHAWLDAAVRIGWLDGHGDDNLFTLP